MATGNLAHAWARSAPHVKSVLRMVTAIMFILAGTSKLVAFPVGMPPNNATAQFLTQVWFAGVLETFGGGLLLFGLFTRPVAFIVSGEMAVAYFQVHLPQSPWPSVNGGTSAALFCFIWLYFSAAGAGPWSLDAVRGRAH